MNVFTVDKNIMNTILPLTMLIPEAVEVITMLITVFLPVESVIKVKEVRTGSNGVEVTFLQTLLDKPVYYHG